MSNKHHNRSAADTAGAPLAATQPQPIARATSVDAVAVTVTAPPEADAGALAAEVERSILGPTPVPYGATDVESGLRLTIQRRDEEIAELRADLQRVNVHRPRVDHTALALQTTALVDLHREHCGKPGYKGRYLDAATKVGNALCAEIDRG